MPQNYAEAPRRAPGARLFDGIALAGIILVFVGPAVALFTGASGMTAGTIGYAGIALFAGGIAARYGFAESPRPVVQLLKNLAAAVLITGVFYLVFLLIL